MSYLTVSVNFASVAQINAGSTNVTSISPANLQSSLGGGSYNGNVNAVGLTSRTGGVAVNGSGSVVLESGSLQIGTGAGPVTLYRAASDTWQTDDVFVIGNATGSSSRTTGALRVAGGVGVQGAMYVGGDVTAYATSDARLKDNVKVIINALDKVDKLNGVEFDWNAKSEKTGHDVGLLAQEVNEVLPEVVTTREDGTLAIKYEKVVPLLVEAIKELKKKVDVLEKKAE